MQLNSNNFSKLKKFNITRADLLNNPCICVYSGAWVLAKNFQAYGRNWDSVGIYNAGPRQDANTRELLKVSTPFYSREKTYWKGNQAIPEKHHLLMIKLMRPPKYMTLKNPANRVFIF